MNRFPALSDLPQKILEDGTRCCINCEKPLQGRQQRYCSPECADAIYEKYLWDNIKEKVFKRDNFTCQMCGLKPSESESHLYFENGDWHSLEVDHKIPFAKGGSHSLDNLQTLCKKCHKKKTITDFYGFCEKCKHYHSKDTKIFQKHIEIMKFQRRITDFKILLDNKARHQ